MRDRETGGRTPRDRRTPAARRAATPAFGRTARALRTDPAPTAAGRSSAPPVARVTPRTRTRAAGNLAAPAFTRAADAVRRTGLPDAAGFFFTAPAFFRTDPAFARRDVAGARATRRALGRATDFFAEGFFTLAFIGRFEPAV